MSWRAVYVGWGITSFLLFLGGWAMAFTHNDGHRIVRMGIPFGPWFLLWFHRNPREAVLVGAALAVTAHEQHRRNQTRTERANAGS